MTGLKLAIFDVDGTLIDSQGHINAAMAEAFAALGLEPPGRAEIRAVVGLSLPNAIATLAPDFDEPTLAKAVAAYKDAFAALADLQGAAASPLYPGTVEMLDVLARHERLLLGIATGKSRRGLDRVLDLHGLTSRFVTTQVADDHPSKPHPAMVLAALDAWQPPERPGGPPLPSRLVSWSRSSLLGAVITGSALGLREVIEPPRDEQIVIEVDADGEPLGLPIRLLLDPDDPAGSLCIVRRDSPPPVV